MIGKLKIFKVLMLITILLIASSFLSQKVKFALIQTSKNSLALYYNVGEYFSNLYTEHFKQVQEIQKLKARNVELEKYSILFDYYKSELNELLSQKGILKQDPNIKLLRVLSYINIEDYNKFWVNFPEFNPEKIYGVIYNNQSAGIIVSNNKQPMLILQNDPKSLFSVVIGNEKIPGVAQGNGQEVIIKYIPKWLNPQIGDEVFTSGLDGVFFEGVFVGQVTEILDEDLYKSVKISTGIEKQVPIYIYTVMK